MNKMLKLGLIFFIVTTNAIISSAAMQEQINNSLSISGIISISNVTDHSFSELAKKENLPYEDWGVSCEWSPDGSKLLVRSSYNPLDAIGLDALYILNPDGTELKEIITTRNNTENTALAIPSNKHGEIAQWDTNGYRIAFCTNVYPLKDFISIADCNGSFLRAVGTNFTTADSIRENISNIAHQRDFSWNPEGADALVLINDQLYLVNQDGFIIRQLTNKSIENNVRTALFSHAGNKIAFNGENLWVISKNGTDLKQLSQKAVIIGWSYDDSKIYYRTFENENSTFYVINPDGTDKTKISSGSMDDYLSVAQNGKILFTKSIFNDSSVSSRLYVADADGKNQKLLDESNSEYDYLLARATWSPDGKKIAYSGGTMNYDGTEKYAIELGAHYSWQPSENYIAFEHVDDINSCYKICVATPNGSECIQISPKDNSSYSLVDWSPDGSRLLIIRHNSDEEEIFVVKFNGYDEVLCLYVPDNITSGKEFPIWVKSMSKPIKNAQITFNGNEIGMTNETGYFKFIINESGRYVLNASKKGYIVSSKLIIVHNGSLPSVEEGNTSDTTNNNSEFTTPGFGIFSELIALCVVSIIRRNQYE